MEGLLCKKFSPGGGYVFRLLALEEELDAALAVPAERIALRERPGLKRFLDDADDAHGLERLQMAVHGVRGKLAFAGVLRAQGFVDVPCGAGCRRAAAPRWSIGWVVSWAYVAEVDDVARVADDEEHARKIAAAPITRLRVISTSVNSAPNSTPHRA